ncbi:tetratricopeptide repeat protein [Gloeothece verrucosa]|uniref:TPR repeat-containing protein n=1 Tax=Gloeothece verrucosa (strain PCC 7822) TaxID=497965 RepID=E0U597_GLOV7|nr:tetratricopeptide repeat protein [Gloeothece verrucosa]ADN12376.1 TPR repeat-containing protein [Gloeothece verrucosa PCC 7822]
MEEQPITNPIEPTNENDSVSKTASNANIFDAVSVVAAIGGAVASLVTQQVAVVAFPLALSVGVHVLNRRQSINALQQHFENRVLAQNLHIVKTEEKLLALEQTLGQFKQETWLALEVQQQDHNKANQELSEEINQLQKQTSTLEEFTQSIESKEQQLTAVVEELRQLENYSQALRAEPSAAEVHYQRGVSHQRLGDKLGAIEDYSDAIRLDSKYAQAYHSRGILYAELGKRKLAVDDLRTASKLYFEQGDIDSYQKARDLGKEFYDLRDVMEEQVTVNAENITEPSDSPTENKGKAKFKPLSSVSVERLFA